MAQAKAVDRRDPKFVIPKRHAFDVQRKKLLKRLQKYRDSKLITVIAPAGYGKTVSLAQFSQMIPGPVVWLSLTADDAEAATLSRSVAAAARYTIPGLRLERYEQSTMPTSGSERLASALASDLNRVQDNLVFIFEELEHLTTDSGRWLTTFIRNLGEGHQVIASSRGDIEADFSRFTASGEVVSITVDALTFDAQESTQLLKRAGSTVDAEEARSACDGWPAALGMVAHGAPLETPSHDLVTGIIKGLDPDLQAVLPEVAVAATWSEQSCRELGCRLPSSWLRRVRRSGLPLLPLGLDIYRPHQVVLEVLESFLRQQPSRHADLHLAAARQAESSGELLRALDHLHSGGHFSRAQGLAEELLPQWQTRSDWGLVRRAVLPFLPHQLSPKLKTALATAFIETGEPVKGEVLLNEQISSNTGNGMTFFALSLLAYRRSKFQLACDLADEGLEIATEQREFTNLLRMKAVALADVGLTENAFEAATKAVKRAEKLGDASLRVATLSVLQYVIYKRGDLNRCIELCKYVIELAFAANIPFKAYGAFDSLIYIYGLVGRSDESLKLIDQMLVIGETEYPLALPRMLARRGDYHSDNLSFELAVEDYTRAFKGLETFGDVAMASSVANNLSECYAALERYELAEDWLLKAHVLTGSDSYIFSSTHYYLSKGKVSFCKGDFERAKGALQKHNMLERDDLGYIAGVLVADAYLAEISRQRGELTFEKIETLVSKMNAFLNDWPLKTEAHHLNVLFRTCIDREWFAERFKSLLETKPDAPGHSPSPVLEISTLGSFDVLLNSKSIVLPPKTRELVVYLALHGACSTEILSDALWPHLPLDTARNNLKGQIRVLKLSLEDAGLAKAELQLWSKNAGYDLRPLLEVRLDVQDIERAVRTTNTEMQISALEQCSGDFLTHSEAEWAIEARGRYREMAVSLALSLGAANEPENPEESLIFYRRAVEIEPLTEEGYEGIKRTGQRIGNVNEVKWAESALKQAHRGEIPAYHGRILN